MRLASFLSVLVTTRTRDLFESQEFFFLSNVLRIRYVGMKIFLKKNQTLLRHLKETHLV